MSQELLTTEEMPLPLRKVYRFSYTGDGSEFFLLVLKNVLLNIVTLGIYSSWAKTENRKYLWRHIDIDGHRLSYTGTGLELFLGLLKILAGYLVVSLGFFAGTFYLQKNHPSLVPLAILPLYLIIFAVLPIAIYGARAYLMSRTVWRGLRFGMERKTMGFARLYWTNLLLTVVTLGIYAPFAAYRVEKFLRENTKFGNQNFGYDGKAKEVFFIYVKGILFSILTLGIYSFWMSAELERYNMSHTTFLSARGNSQLTGASLLGLTMAYLLGTTLTLGIAFPWLMTFVLKELIANYSFEGEIDFALIAKGQAQGAASTEALADALDVGMAF